MTFKVLYLDDESELCDIFAEEISCKEVQVTTFTNAKSAIDHSIKDQPNMIFLDYRLNDTSGDEVALCMPADIPKYLITGDIMLKPNFDFVQIFSKPTDYKQLAELIQSARKIKD